MVMRTRATTKRSHLRLGDTGELAKRRAERAAKAAFWSHKVGAALLMLVAVWMLRSLLIDPRFAVRDIQVVGAETLDTMQVKEQVNPRYVGGNPSLFLINGAEVAQRVTETAAQVESVAVRCQLPGRVVITVSERQDVLIWESAGRYWWVDLEGMALGPATKRPERGDGQPVILVRDVDGVAVTPEGYIPGVPWEMLRALSEALPAAREYEYTRALGLVVRITGEHWPVYLGHDGDAATKVAIMRPLAEELMAEGVAVAYIDMRYESRPFYKAVE